METRLKEKSGLLENLGTHVNTLEIELVKAKQALGEALNQINDFRVTKLEPEL